MKKGSEEEFDLDAVMAKIRLEVAARKRASGLDSAGFTVPSAPGAWKPIRLYLEAARGQAQAARVISSMFHLNWLVRPFARIVSRFVLSITKFQWNPQSEINRLTAEALETVDNNGIRMAAATAQQVSELKSSIESLSVQVDELGKQLESQRVASFEVIRSLEDKVDQAIVKQQKKSAAAQERLQAVEVMAERVRLRVEIEDEASEKLEQMYLSFENVFRGTREDILNRQKIYLPFIKSAISSDETNLLVDLGCGRGEWLELARDAGYKVRGVDSNDHMVEFCRSAGFDVVKENALAYLKAQLAESVSVITGFHIIEHLETEQRFILLAHAYRVLRAGGLLILETPDPENVRVGSCSFYLDPTHRVPIPSDLLEYMFRAEGFSEISVKKLHPSWESPPEAWDEKLREMFYGAMDFAVIGKKP